MKLVLREKGCSEGAGEPEKTLGDNFGFPITQPRTMEETSLEDAGSAKRGPHIAMIGEECGCGCEQCSGGEHHPEEDEEEITQDILAGLYSDPEALYIVIGEEDLNEEKKKGDRCIRIAKRKYNRWPSAYASGAVVKCRQGKIWKGLKESSEHIEYEVYEATLEEAVTLLEKYKPNFSLEKSQGLHGWFKRNKGKGWIDCRTGKPCGRQKAGRGAKRKYPACRPTKAQCNKSGTRRKRGKAAVSWTPKKDK